MNSSSVAIMDALCRVQVFNIQSHDSHEYPKQLNIRTALCNYLSNNTCTNEWDIMVSQYLSRRYSFRGYSQTSHSETTSPSRTINSRYCPSNAIRHWSSQSIFDVYIFPERHECHWMRKDAIDSAGLDLRWRTIVSIQSTAPKSTKRFCLSRYYETALQHQKFYDIRKAMDGNCPIQQEVLTLQKLNFWR